MPRKRKRSCSITRIKVDPTEATTNRLRRFYILRSKKIKREQNSIFSSTNNIYHVQPPLSPCAKKTNAPTSQKTNRLRRVNIRRAKNRISEKQIKFSSGRVRVQQITNSSLQNKHCRDISMVSSVNEKGEMKTVTIDRIASRNISLYLHNKFILNSHTIVIDHTASSSTFDNRFPDCDAHLPSTSNKKLDKVNNEILITNTPANFESHVDKVQHLRRCYKTHTFGGPNITCTFCEAKMWYEESVVVTPKVDYPVFSLCCKQGMIHLPPPHPTPHFLDRLLQPDNVKLYHHFKDNIRLYNSLFQFTSLGGKIDHNINNGSGPYIFRINGQTHHRLGSLLPPPGERPKFAQLYIYDTRNEEANRISAISGDSDASNINIVIVNGILSMLNEVNKIGKAFRMARDRYEEDDTPLRLRLLSTREPQGRRPAWSATARNYTTPVGSEIAALIVGDIGVGNGDRDIIIEHRSQGLQRIGILHPLYMSMQYPLLFPHGEDGYLLGIPFVPSPVKEKLKRTTVSMREYYAYQIQTRFVPKNTLLRGGRLFQQFITDAFSATEEDRLHFIRNNQTKLRADMYKDIRDAMKRGDVRGESVGKRIILPASFTGSPRYLFQNYQDALAICRVYGFPDLFITFTCNAHWDEIDQTVQLIDGQRAEDRPDAIARIFELKAGQLLDDLMKRDHFGKALAVTSTVEFQKRGLPHIHILLWLQPCAKFKVAADIDKFVSAEIPDKKTDPLGYEAVTSFMIHGPCGSANYNAPCMTDQRCTKFFPKPFQSETLIDDYGYPVYRRRDTHNYCTKNKIQLDNRFVVPHNVDLVVRYKAHINVEICNHTRAIKYLFKYINKGPDRARVVIERDAPNNKNQPIEHDEIKSYLDCRYLSAYEAAWRLFMFPIHHREPATLRLPIHLPDQQNIYYGDSEPLHQIINRPNIGKTMFTEWMVANQRYESARGLLYADFPTKWVWHKDTTEWKPRINGKCIGRLIYINPAAGELYYLRLLVNIVRGAKNHQEIRTFNGIIYPTFQSACEAHGLLGDDKEWNEALLQASHWASSAQLRDLFVTILLFCEVTNPSDLFRKNWRAMSDDIEYRVKKALNVQRFSMPDDVLQNYVLLALEELLQKNCSSLEDKQLPQPNRNLTTSIDNRLVFEESNYNTKELEEEHLQMFASLNPEQRNIYTVIKQSVDMNEGKMFFVNGHGGTGKTYLWRTLIAGIRSNRKIVLAVASSGIASLLLPGGRTAHSRFKIPITIDQWSTCEIKKGTQLAGLLRQTSLIIWDEATTIHRYCIEAFDRSLRDILHDPTTCSSEKAFGGITVAFGGDFRQILPVIPSGTKTDILNATICNSGLWKKCEFYTLTTNMRLLQSELDDHSRNELSNFAEWILQIGDGNISSAVPHDSENGSWITIPDEFLINRNGDALKIIFEAVYVDFEENYRNPLYLHQRAIVTPHNNTVDLLNTYALKKIPGPTSTYLSCDTLSKSSTGFANDDILYPPEVLNSITFPGIPNHVLILKIGAVVMLLRNISQTNGLCNGTRLLITNLAANVIEATIITGEHLGAKVFIPKIIFTINDKKWPFVLNRKQFPVRLSYAMTINKSQGQTLDFVGLYLPRPIFTHGQLYVALSRVTSKHGLRILIHDENGNTSNITRNVVYKEIFESIQK